MGLADGVEEIAITIVRRVADPGDTHRGLTNVLMVDQVANHQAVDLMTVMPHGKATGFLVHSPGAHGHIISILATPEQCIHKATLLGAFREHPRIRIFRIADARGFSGTGGGDNVAAAGRFGPPQVFDDVCTSGGGMVRDLSGQPLPVVDALRRATRSG